jgi:predicted amidohydrolase
MTFAAAPFTAACVQLNSKRTLDENLPTIRELILDAASRGADFITLPECSGAMEPIAERSRANTPIEDEHAGITLLAGLARDKGVWILVGSFGIKLPAKNNEPSKIANRSYLFDPNGAVVTTYDKIHMFDVDIGDGQTYRESATYEPGACGVVADLPWGRLGLSICYDVRFAYLYRALAQAGADFLTVPAAFTKVSGEAHWHVLQRARAIETGAFVISAAQCGTHAEGRQTFGHSLIVDPWGTVLADGGEEVGVITAAIDRAAVVEARRKIPALTHDRDVRIVMAPIKQEGAAAPRQKIA